MLRYELISSSLEPSGNAFDSTVGCGASLEGTAAFGVRYLNKYLPRVLPYGTNLFCLRHHPPGDVEPQVLFVVFGEGIEISCISAAEDFGISDIFRRVLGPPVFYAGNRGQAPLEAGI